MQAFLRLQYNLIALSLAGPNHAAGCEDKGIAEAKTRLVPAISASVRVCVAAKEQLKCLHFTLKVRSILVVCCKFHIAKCQSLREQVLFSGQCHVDTVEVTTITAYSHMKSLRILK